MKNAGYTVSMTRTGDTLPSLVERPTQANAEKSRCFVSIHINSVDNAPNANELKYIMQIQITVTLTAQQAKSLQPIY